jgi:hypothetical protein
LYPFISTLGPVYSTIAITNLSPPNAAGAAAGTCTLTFYGTPNAPAPITINTILPGSVYTTNVWQQPVGLFQGYVIAACNFKAQGVALGTVATGGTPPQIPLPTSAIPAVVNP